MQFKRPIGFQDKYEQLLLVLTAPIMFMISLVCLATAHYELGVAISLLGLTTMLFELYDRQKYRREPKEITAAMIELQAREMCALRELDPDKMIQGNLSTFGPHPFHGNYTGMDKAVSSVQWRVFYYPAFDMLVAAGRVID